MYGQTTYRYHVDGLWVTIILIGWVVLRWVVTILGQLMGGF